MDAFSALGGSGRYGIVTPKHGMTRSPEPLCFTGAPNPVSCFALGILFGALLLSVSFAWVTIIEYPPEAQLVATVGGFTGDFSIVKAFTALFGNYDTSSQSSSVTGIEGRSR